MIHHFVGLGIKHILKPYLGSVSLWVWSHQLCSWSICMTLSVFRMTLSCVCTKWHICHLKYYELVVLFNLSNILILSKCFIACGIDWFMVNLDKEEVRIILSNDLLFYKFVKRNFLILFILCMFKFIQFMFNKFWIALAIEYSHDHFHHAYAIYARFILVVFATFDHAYDANSVGQHISYGCIWFFIPQ
jgi:hypothetical protein